jgi:predicted GNAT family N-acyltransferase
MEMHIHLKRACSLDDLIQVFVVRGIVFCSEQQVSYDLERDEHDCSAIHILGEVGGEPAAAGRIRAVDGWAKLERIAVRQRFRGRGFGHRLTDFMLETARQGGFSRFKMHAQAHLEDFYRCHGFRARGEIFDEAGIDHILMIIEEQK